MAVIEGAIFLVFYVVLASKKYFLKRNKIKALLFVASYAIFTIWVSSFLPLGLHTLCVVLFATITLSFVTRSGIYNSSIIVCVTTVFIALVDVPMTAVFSLLSGMELDEMLNNPVSYSIFAVTSKAVQAFASILLYKFENEKIHIRLFKDKYNQYLFYIFQLFLMVIFIVGVYYGIGSHKDFVTYNSLIVAIFLISLVLSYFDLREREVLLNIANRKKNLEEYVKNLEDVVNVIRREKHDFMNHINTLYAICHLEKPNALAMVDRYVSRLTDNLKASYRFYETGNSYVDGLLAIKTNVAFENDIELKAIVEAGLCEADADDCDLAGIVGNIINNALECLIHSEQKEKRILFKTGIQEPYFCLCISNNGPEIPDYLIHRVFDQGFTTKPGNGEHGFGLYITKQLVNKNRGQIYVSSSRDETYFEIYFKLRKQEGFELGKADRRVAG